MVGYFQRNWALILLLAITTVLVALLFEISWPVTYVELIAIPADASIVDGNGFRWSSPARIPVPNEGIQLALSREGMLPLDTLLDPLLAGETVVLQMQYQFRVEFVTDPAGSSVILDGDFAGHTPFETDDVAPGTHSVIVTTECGVVHLDSFTIITNEPLRLEWVLPSIQSEEMLLVTAGSMGTVRAGEDGSPDTLNSYLIGLHEITAIEFCDWLSYLESYPAGDSTWRWGRTDLIEELFPGDYPIPFYITPWGQWGVLDGLEELPVSGLSSTAARGYCEWLTVIDNSGLIYRLPSEREWEVAALAGGTGPWPWGSRRPDGSLLNLSDDSEVLLRRHPSIEDGFVQAAPVGSYPANNWGLSDMAGNVWEWCEPASPDSMTPARGGSWLSSGDDCRCDSRMLPDSGLGYPYIGFRLAASLPD